MSRYIRGDVVLAWVRIDVKGERKVRPVVVIRTDPDGALLVHPVSCTPSCDIPSIPLGLGDFLQGGLDIHDASYVIAGRPIRVPLTYVAGKKGRLTFEAMDAICP